jgi:uncharacterized membrane protein YdbT with pleckstrin-like domain
MIILHKDEHIIFQIRRHWFILFSEISILLFIAILPIIFLVITNAYQIKFSFSGYNSISLFVFFYSLILLILWIIGFMFWTDYYLDTWIVTNNRIIDVEQKGLFSREVSVINMDKIQDVTSDVSGMVATVIDYGDVHIQTAGQNREFIIKDVPEPGIIRDKLGETIARFKKNMQTSV